MTQGIFAAALASALLAAPSAAAPSCLPGHGTVGTASIRGVAVGSTAQVGGARASSVSYCIAHGGDLTIALDPAGAIVLVRSTGSGDDVADVGPGSSARAAYSTFPRMRAVVRVGSETVYRLDRRQIVVGIAAGRVTFIAAADRLLLESPGRLAYWLRRVELAAS